MKRAHSVTLAAVLLGTASIVSAQQAGIPSDLVGSWTLSAAEKNVASGESTRARTPRGLLVLDGAGHVFEFFSAPSGDDSGSADLDRSRTLATYGGFWGRFEVDEEAGRITFQAAAGVSPNVRGLTFSRTYELDGDRLVVTSTDEPQAQRDTRWVWQRAPVVEHLTPAYREVVGFWEHVEEGRVDLTTGEVANTNRRAPSVIVYTPSGFVGVHFPGLGREQFDEEPPTEDQAQAALRGYIGYFGTLGVYPGEVSHNLLSGVSPGTGSILRRYAEIDGNELIVTLQSGTARPAGEGPRVATQVWLRRLSGVDDMLPPAD